MVVAAAAETVLAQMAALAVLACLCPRPLLFKITASSKVAAEVVVEVLLGALVALQDAVVAEVVALSLVLAEAAELGEMYTLVVVQVELEPLMQVAEEALRIKDSTSAVQVAELLLQAQLEVLQPEEPRVLVALEELQSVAIRLSHGKQQVRVTAHWCKSSCLQNLQRQMPHSM